MLLLSSTLSNINKYLVASDDFFLTNIIYLLSCYVVASN